MCVGEEIVATQDAARWALLAARGAPSPPLHPHPHTHTQAPRVAQPRARSAEKYCLRNGPSHATPRSRPCGHLMHCENSRWKGMDGGGTRTRREVGTAAHTASRGPRAPSGQGGQPSFARVARSASCQRLSRAQWTTRRSMAERGTSIACPSVIRRPGGAGRDEPRRRWPSPGRALAAPTARPARPPARTSAPAAASSASRRFRPFPRLPRFPRFRRRTWPARGEQLLHCKRRGFPPIHARAPDTGQTPPPPRLPCLSKAAWSSRNRSVCLSRQGAERSAGITQSSRTDGSSKSHIRGERARRRRRGGLTAVDRVLKPKATSRSMTAIHKDA